VKLLYRGFLASVAFAGVAGAQDFAGVPLRNENGQTLTVAKLPGFAVELASMRPIAGPKDWPAPSIDETWQRLGLVQLPERQRARWDYALALKSAGRDADALGVLEVMIQDDPDLGLAGTFQLAMASVMVPLGRNEAAAAALNQPSLLSNPEACAWRLRVFAGAKAYRLAVNQLPCAIPAINARGASDRLPFVISAADSALNLGHPEAAIAMLRSAPAKNPDANLIMARAYTMLGQLKPAELALTVAERGPTIEQQMGARLGRIELAVAGGAGNPAAWLKSLSDLEYVWRGGELEERTLRLNFRLAQQAHDQRSALASAATLIRYHKLGADLPNYMRDVQFVLTSLLDPQSPVPIEEAAGVYWDYRELAPAGAEGAALATRLADRFAAMGLYDRAAELLGYQLTAQEPDVTQGPLSVRVAKFYILSGHPEKAITALTQTSRTVFPSPMVWDRKRLEAVALFQLGRQAEALAVLQDVPASDGLRLELMWRKRDYQSFITTSRQVLPSGKGLDEVSQSMVLRYAIALGMLGREEDLAVLRTRYLKAFSTLPSASAFDVLTREPGSIDTASLSTAMANISTASPAGDLADLLDMAPSATKS
jgi:hypothetical protein